MSETELEKQETERIFTLDFIHEFMSQIIINQNTAIMSEDVVSNNNGFDSLRYTETIHENIPSDLQPTVTDSMQIDDEPQEKESSSEMIPAIEQKEQHVTNNGVNHESVTVESNHNDDTEKPIEVEELQQQAIEVPTLEQEQQSLPDQEQTIQQPEQVVVPDLQQQTVPDLLPSAVEIQQPTVIEEHHIEEHHSPIPEPLTSTTQIQQQIQNDIVESPIVEEHQLFLSPLPQQPTTNNMEQEPTIPESESVATVEVPPESEVSETIVTQTTDSDRMEIEEEPIIQHAEPQSPTVDAETLQSVDVPITIEQPLQEQPLQIETNQSETIPKRKREEDQESETTPKSKRIKTEQKNESEPVTPTTPIDEETQRLLKIFGTGKDRRATRSRTKLEKGTDKSDSNLTEEEEK
jgi:hypothetical protein